MSENPPHIHQRSDKLTVYVLSCSDNLIPLVFFHCSRNCLKFALLVAIATGIHHVWIQPAHQSLLTKSLP